VAKGSGNRKWQSAITAMASTVVGLTVVFSLYWAQDILIPLALAIFLTFLLTPLVSWLQRRRIRRIPAVLLVMLLTVVLLGGMIYLVTSQVTSLVGRLTSPEGERYNKNIHAKIEAVTNRLNHLTSVVDHLLSPAPSNEATTKEDAPPAPRKEPSQLLSHVLPALLLTAKGLAGGGLALVLTAFILADREDMRNRLIRLLGQGRITMATKALDEAGSRISRFLVMQALIGAIAGISIGLGLLIIGVEYALLWGFIVFLMRYVPYIGIWLAAIPPVVLSFAMSEGWTQPLLVVGWIVITELFCAYVLEPWWYGHSMGVSSTALLVSAAFCAFLWGPIGMVLSSPITVCLVVLGKYHPRLGFLDVLLGAEPVLGPALSFYQRLLARDQDEAADIVHERLKEAPANQVLDELIVASLVYAKRDRERDDLDEETEEFIVQTASEIGEELIERLEVPVPAEPTPGEELPRGFVLGCPAHDKEDETVLHLLARMLDPNCWDVEVLTTNTLSSELLARIAEKHPNMICIAALPPGGLTHTRYLCKRLRLRFPDVKIIVARCGLESSAEENIGLLHQAGADFITTSLADTKAQLAAWRRIVPGSESVTTEKPREKPEVVRI
jgi:predicted PurR-regulated permease PerM